MIYNIPSICLFNKSIYEPNPDFSLLYEDLSKVGIICSDADRLPEILDNFIFHNTWFSEDIQKVRNEFCKI